MEKAISRLLMAEGIVGNMWTIANMVMVRFTGRTAANCKVCGGLVGHRGVGARRISLRKLQQIITNHLVGRIESQESLSRK
mmetsp:Transcript_60888/g.117340  ORF Transcript_60888/g.117340 Transcript_60888/m.117340 type:complete len:81 (+) Transcript_60888:344-586(+)